MGNQQLYAPRYDVLTFPAPQTFSKLDGLEHTANRGMVINPIVGPEPITGTQSLLCLSL